MRFHHFTVAATLTILSLQWSAAAAPAAGKSAPATKKPAATQTDDTSDRKSPAPTSRAKQPSADEARVALANHEATRPMPDPESKGDAEYEAVFAAQENLYTVTKVKLIGDLWRAEPSAPELEDLMGFRWHEYRRIRNMDLPTEIDTFTKAHPEATKTISQGWYEVATRDMTAAARDADKAIAAANAFIARYPDDNRSAELLFSAASRLSEDERKETTDRILKDWPTSAPAKRIAGDLRRKEAVGKPFELAFTEWLSGRDMTMADFKGKVVVIDFWATWCGPCKAELPHVKELYKTYHESGLEIIGVSLDVAPEKGGGEALTKYCREKDITWPQYYQGNYWDSEFSRGWGINSIPAVFIVDRHGILHSTDARGKLDEMIPKLLAEPATP